MIQNRILIHTYTKVFMLQCKTLKSHSCWNFLVDTVNKLLTCEGRLLEDFYRMHVNARPTFLTCLKAEDQYRLYCE